MHRFFAALAILIALNIGSGEGVQGDPRPFKRKPALNRTNQASADNQDALDSETRLLRALQKRLSVEFREQPLSEVVKVLSSKSQIDIVVDARGLADEGVSPDATVTFSASGVRLSTLLDRLLAPVKLDYAIGDEALKVTSRVRAKGELVTRTYAIGELVDTSNGVMQAGYSDEDDGGKAPARPVRKLGDTDSAFGTFIAKLQTQVRPESWEQTGGPGSAEFYARTGTLVVRQTGDVHEEIQEYLDKFRKTPPTRPRARSGPPRKPLGTSAR